MNRTRPYPPPARSSVWRGVLRGLWAVAVLLSSALDHYLAAVAGTYTIAWQTRRVAAVIGTAYRTGRYGSLSSCTDLEVAVFHFEVIDESTDPDQPPTDRKDTGI